MVANDLKIQIIGVDRFTAVAKRVDASIVKLAAPVKAVGRDLDDLSRSAGFDRLGASFARVTERAEGFSRSIGAIGAPLGRIAELGTLAGAAMSAIDWAKTGRSAVLTSQKLGVNVQRLQELQLAAERAGASSDEMTGALGSLADSARGAIYGGDARKLSMFNMLGIDIGDWNHGARQVEDILGNVADALKRKQAEWRAQGRSESQVASSSRALLAELGISDDLLPMLEQGRAGIERYLEAVRKTHAVLTPEQAKKADEFSQSLTDLGQSALGVSRNFGAYLGPALTPIIKDITSFVQQHPGALADAEFATVGLAAVKLGASLASPVAGLLRFGWVAAEAAYSTLPALALQAGMAAEAVGADGLASGFVSLGAAAGSVSLGALITGLGGVAAAAKMTWDRLQEIDQALADPNLKDWKTRLGLNAERIGVASNPLLAVQDWEVNRLGRWLGLWGDKGGNKGDSPGPAAPPGAAAVIGPAAPAALAIPAAPVAAATRPPGSQPLGISQNNPGNLRSWGSAPIARGFAVFSSAMEGLSAMAGNLHAYGNAGWDTPAAIASHWAPAGDNNDPVAYANGIAQRSGFGVNEHLDLSRPEVLERLMPAIIRQEQGYDPYGPEQEGAAIRSRLYGALLATGATVERQSPAPAQGQVHVQVDFRGMPPGATATATGSGGVSTAVRVVRSMVTDVSP